MLNIFFEIEGNFRSTVLVHSSSDFSSFAHLSASLLDIPFSSSFFDDIFDAYFRVRDHAFINDSWCEVLYFDSDDGLKYGFVIRTEGVFV